MPIVELDPLAAWKAIEGYPNELSGEAQAQDAFYRQFRCKRCGGPVQKEVSVAHAFSDPTTLVPRCLLRCRECRFLFDPHSGLAVELGDRSKASVVITEE